MIARFKETGKSGIQLGRARHLFTRVVVVVLKTAIFEQSQTFDSRGSSAPEYLETQAFLLTPFGKFYET